MKNTLLFVVGAVFIFALLLLSAMGGTTVSAQGPTATPTTGASPSPTTAPAQPTVSPTPAQAPPAAAVRDDPAIAAELGAAVQNLAPNTGQWYKFNYVTPINEFPRQLVTIRLLNGVTNGLGFEVWSTERFNEGNWWEITPVGRGTREFIPNCEIRVEGEVQQCFSNDLTWVGGFGAPGTYYVRIENPTNNPMMPQLIIGGPGLSNCASENFLVAPPAGQAPPANQGFVRVQCRDLGPGLVVTTGTGG